ncbi:uncharacterized protein LOC129801056 [Phlebotomus papatasi]|uniref:uncharacterized protein LOC129801056 n=1 Tax=Phlebotomus papatasi TaxID=29031 RepID=UPI0024845F02|nr:uncharacterized protein LOC129801056 [Phlebotomus papatasi]
MPLRKGRSPVTGTAATSTPHQAAATVPHIVAPIGTFLAPTTTYVSVPRIPQDPLTACLDANGTYICTAYNSRCLIIQKVTPQVIGFEGINPEEYADYCKSASSTAPSCDGYFYAVPECPTFDPSATQCVG